MRLSVHLRRAGPPAEAETAEVEFEVDDIVPSAEIEAWLAAWSAEVRNLVEHWVAGPRSAQHFVTPPVHWDVESQRYKQVGPS